MTGEEQAARVRNLLRKTPDTPESMATLALTAAVMIGRRARETGAPLERGLELIMLMMGTFAVKALEGEFDA